jgi:hypothetical protein
MKQRRQTLARMQLVQDQLHKLSAWKLAALDQQKAALAEAQKATIEAIGRDGFAHGFLIESGVRHLRGIDRQIQAVAAQHARQSKHAVEQGARAKLVERIVDKVEVAYKAQQERIELGEAIERAVARGRASPA